ncbi:MAG: DUF1552 domain-containing protein [Planctomycetota bacterium]|jgi:hypothetical protein|nr:DUF1552 domain-containing protein [Planctomycetota bacterium]MDP6502288.1 DUF1552 domain-containing protein [Planctomycetota bacterium]
MNITTNSNRRTFLRNGAKVVALPFLGSLLPSGILRAEEKKLAAKPIRRLLWLSMGHGHMEDHFYPKEAGAFSEIELPPGFDPLKKNLSHVTMVSNFSNMQNRQPHEGSEAVLTCSDVVGFPGKSRHNSISCDQVAAAHLGKDTRYESLQLNCLKEDSGNGHGGVAMSYRSDGSPLPGYASTLQVYHKLFGGNVGKQELMNNLRQRRSIFDILKFEGNSSKRLLSKDDREKLDEYTTSIRDIEISLSREREWMDVPYPKATLARPGENLQGEAAIRSMFKMIVAAYQTDATRVITYRMPDAGLLKSMNISSSPHTLSHYGANTSLHELNLQRTRKWMQLYSDFIDQLRASKDPLDPNGGSIFDNSLIYNGGGLRTAHRNTNVPCLLTGGAFKGLKHGQHRMAAKENTPLANLWTTMLQDAGAPVDRFADANATAAPVLTTNG